MKSPWATHRAKSFVVGCKEDLSGRNAGEEHAGTLDRLRREVMPGGSSWEVRLLRRKQKGASMLAQVSQKARIIAASEGFAFASTTSWCQPQLQAEASHCKYRQEQPKNTSDAQHQDCRTSCAQFRFAGKKHLQNKRHIATCRGRVSKAVSKSTHPTASKLTHSSQ
ncbi:hypothetical protein Y696_10655 [Mesotoga sp. H07pep.5.4]|nr:hypothetical protein Y696_10655 [Mesotoga sp. H07pep.5.4]